MTLEKAYEIIKEIYKKEQSIFHIERQHYDDFEDLVENGLQFDRNNEEHKELVGKIISLFYFEILNFCGCGMPEASCDYILALLSLFYNGKDYNSIRYQTLFGGDYTVDKQLVYNLSDERLDFILKWLDSMSLTEHGTSVYGSWLTGYGTLIKTLLKIRKDLDIEIDSIDYDELT